MKESKFSLCNVELPSFCSVRESLSYRATRLASASR